MKNIKITGEALSIDAEAVATLLKELKKLIRVWYDLRFQALIGSLGPYAHIKGGTMPCARQFYSIKDTMIMK